MQYWLRHRWLLLSEPPLAIYLTQQYLPDGLILLHSLLPHLLQVFLYSLYRSLASGCGFVNGMVASHLLCHSGTINRHSLNGALLS
ncbi:hypothetical protein DN596_23900 [Klebsiella pneumoniae]|nr:hypothetical protein DN596_23900 [Klebsiella pneumoniae]